MLTTIIKYSLRNRVLTLFIALAVTGLGTYQLYHLPIDVLPDLTRPRATIITEALGLAPEEVETHITYPIESAVIGATGVERVTSSSSVGLSLVAVEFDWNTDTQANRQILVEKLALISDRIPDNVKPQISPVSSVMGHVMQVGVYSTESSMSDVELRTVSDWTIKRRLLSIPGVAQVTVLGGGKQQLHVVVNPGDLHKYDLAISDVERAVSSGDSTTTGGYIDDGAEEMLVRTIGRLRSIDELNNLVISAKRGRPILLNQVAAIRDAAQTRRGDAAINGKPGIILSITKQPGADTGLLTDQIVKALDGMKGSLPRGVHIDTDLYRQQSFIDLSINNVRSAIRDASLLVFIVLILFLFNLRTTLISLTAIPVSVIATALVFKAFGMSINIMTLGGLAIAVGEVVDDAIVDIENIYRRLRENQQQSRKQSTFRIVYQASREVRGSIVFSTILVVLVFVPLFALGGMEGRLFAPLATGYIVSIVASLIVSLTLTPAMASIIMPGSRGLTHTRDNLFLRCLKAIAGYAISFSIRFAWLVFGCVIVATAISTATFLRMPRGFLPPFNEGCAQINVLLPPGSSLSASKQIASLVDQRLGTIQGIRSFSRKTGRAELDEHAEGVNVSEFIVIFEADAHQEDVIADIRRELRSLPGVYVSVEQPLAHLMSHILSGVRAQIGIKVYGDDLIVLQRLADEIGRECNQVQGVTDLIVEQQSEVPQLQILLKREQISRYGMTAKEVGELIETSINGRVVAEFVSGDRRTEIVIRLDDQLKNDVNALERLSLNTPDGNHVQLGQVATIRRASGPIAINHDNARRRVVLQCNAEGRDLQSVANELRSRIEPMRQSLPSGYLIEFTGQVESANSAMKVIGLLTALSIAAMFVTLFILFRSVNLALQVMSALPMATIGGVAALWLTSQTLTVASLVGFISLAGIASRNGILLVTHYLHLCKVEGEVFSTRMIVRAGKERLAPMLMTALTAGASMIPLVVHGKAPGQEILYPVATVILGGLISSTLLDFFVHPALFWWFGKSACSVEATRHYEE